MGCPLCSESKVCNRYGRIRCQLEVDIGHKVRRRGLTQLNNIRFSASFHQGCVKVSPESCFLVQFQVDRKDIQPFGYDDDPKELLVWHTKTKNVGATNILNLTRFLDRNKRWKSRIYYGEMKRSFTILRD